jgi:hypothetical protein
MPVLALLGVSESTLGIVLAISWLVVSALALYRYLRGNQSRRRLLMVLSAASFWLSFSLLQVSGGVSGTVELGLVVLAFVLFTTGTVVGVRWWRQRVV